MSKVSGINNRAVYMICLIGALGGLLFGLDQGFIANSLSTIRKTYSLNLSQAEHYTAVLAYGGIVGALLCGLCTRILGRKKVLVFAGILFSSLSLVSALLPPFEVLTVARFGLGFAVGLASFTVPLYLSETAPTFVRGKMGTLFQLMITVGIFLIAVINFIVGELLKHTPAALTVMFLALLIFSMLMLVGSFFLPESPRWLLMKSKDKKALSALHRLYSNQQEVDAQLAEIKKNIASNRGSAFSMLTKGYFNKVLVVAVVLMMFQQLVGINIMIYYSPTIFGYAGMTGIVAALIIPTANLLFTFPAIKWVEKWGRKKSLYFGSIVMLLSMLVVGFAFLYVAHAPLDTFSRTTLLAASVFYIFGFACSWGPVAWVLCSEIFPQEGREIGMTSTTIINWTFAAAVMANALSFMKVHGNASIFFVFSGFCVLSILFLKFFIPETKGVSLEKIEANVRSGKKIRFAGYTPDEDEVGAL